MRVPREARLEDRVESKRDRFERAILLVCFAPPAEGGMARVRVLDDADLRPSVSMLRDEDRGNRCFKAQGCLQVNYRMNI